MSFRYLLAFGMLLAFALATSANGCIVSWSSDVAHAESRSVVPRWRATRLKSNGSCRGLAASGNAVLAECKVAGRKQLIRISAAPPHESKVIFEGAWDIYGTGMVAHGDEIVAAICGPSSTAHCENWRLWRIGPRGTYPIGFPSYASMAGFTNGVVVGSEPWMSTKAAQFYRLDLPSFVEIPVPGGVWWVGGTGALVVVLDEHGRVFRYQTDAGGGLELLGQLPDGATQLDLTGTVLTWGQHGAVGTMRVDQPGQPDVIERVPEGVSAVAAQPDGVIWQDFSGNVWKSEAGKARYRVARGCHFGSLVRITDVLLACLDGRGSILLIERPASGK